MSGLIEYVHAGASTDGGVTVDVLHLAEGMRARGWRTEVDGSARAVAQRLARERPHVVHVFGCLPMPATWTGILYGSRRAPLVWTPIFHPSRPSTWRGYRAVRAMELFDRVAPWAASAADAVIAATEAEAEFFERRGARSVELIPPAVRARGAEPDPAEVEAFRRRLGLGDGPVVLTVARANRRKALPFGIAAFGRLRALNPRAQWLLVGPEAEFWMGAEPGVTCPGWLTPEEIELAYTVADVLFVPSLYEGLPRAAVEAWSFGLPVVATDRVALAPAIAGEVGDAGRAGEVVPFGDPPAAAAALDALLRDPERMREYGERAARLARSRYGLEAMVDETAAVYERVAGARA